VLPDPHFARHDAGPNVVVVCSPGNVEDYLLLWNLRAAHGDHRLLPIGIPVDQVTPEVIRELARHPHLARNGIPARSLYVTSSSIAVEDLAGLIGEQGPGRIEIGVAGYEDMLTLGRPAGWTRDEALSWSAGVTSFVPLPYGSLSEIFEKPSFGDNTTMKVDIDVIDSPFPLGDGVRINAMNFEYYSGSASRMVSQQRYDAVEITWPSRLLMSEATAAAQDLHFSESEPGRAARVVLSGFDHIWEISNLAHRPLLDLLEDMASRQGFSWAKRQVREIGHQIDAAEGVAPTVDDLPEKSFHEFKRALGNSDAATRFWLLWAERAGLIVKGFRLLCSSCGAKQWIPVAAFSPPITCRGCAVTMATPFGDASTVNFTFRISERLRRVYEHDAMGNLLAVRYFQSIFRYAGGNQLIGAHPGMDVYKAGNDEREGEADALLFFRSGDFVPIEVKRSFGGANPAEVLRLKRLVNVLHAPWSAIAVCQYGHDAPVDFVGLEARRLDSPQFRLILSYDVLLDLDAHWSLGADPFQWDPLGLDQIKEREEKFVATLVNRFGDGRHDWLALDMLDRPSAGQ
jgi:hypothetical protein